MIGIVLSIYWLTTSDGYSYNVRLTMNHLQMIQLRNEAEHRR